MNRHNRYLLGAFAALLIAATPVLCANTLFSDDFTNQTATLIDNWAKSNATTNDMKPTVNGGSFTIDNSAGNTVAEYIHTFGANKPAAFTLSYVLKSAEPSFAGALFCRQPGDYPSGYLLTAINGNVAVYKVTSTINGSNVSISTGDPIFSKTSLDLKPGEPNTLSVSTDGSSFHIFANGAFQGRFTGNSYGAGDISLLLFQNTKAVFGSLSVTDEFKPGEDLTTIFDDFEDGVIDNHWRQDITSGTAPIISETGGKLRMSSVDGSGAYIYRDINLTDFNATVEVTHISGKPTSPYGFFLIGDGPSEMVKFFIVGGGYYRVEKNGDPVPDLTLNNKIRGGKGHDLGLELTDTLTVRKSENSNYEFLVNGEPLAFDLGPVNFNITGIGLICQHEISVAFDNFYVKQNFPVSIRQNGKKQFSRVKSPLTARNHAFYDMRGRKRYTIATSTPGNTQTRAAGIYVNKNGRDVAVKKGKVATE